MFVGWCNLKILCILPFSFSQLYATVPSTWNDFEPSRVLAAPKPQVFAYNSSAMFAANHLDPDTWNLESCGKCALVSCAFWRCVRSGLVDGFAHDQRLRFCTNCGFGVLRRLLFNAAEFLEQEGIFHVLKRTSFLFVEDYLAAKVTLEFDWSAVHGLDWLPCTWETGRFIGSRHMRTSVGKITKMFLSFMKRLWFPWCLGALLVRTRRRSTAAIVGHQNGLLTASLLLSRLRHLAWTMFTVVTWKTTRKSTVTVVVPLRLVIGRNFGQSSTAVVTYS